MVELEGIAAGIEFAQLLKTVGMIILAIGIIYYCIAWAIKSKEKEIIERSEEKDSEDEEDQLL